MIKDIVVNPDGQNGKSAAEDYALSVASKLKAHITGIAIAIDPTVPGASMAFLPVGMLEATRRENESAAKNALERFAAVTTREGISADSRMLRAGFADAADQFGRIARRFDLVVVDQAEPDKNTIAAIISESTLFEAGRPVIVVPYIQRSPLKLDRVMVCWDGSRPAARAIGDALPILEWAGSVEVVIVASESRKQDEIEGADIGQHLARHGLKAEVNRIMRDDLEIADALLSHAMDSSADFIVMGAYGHSRQREFVLGGVTRSMLHYMTVPTLMSH